MEALTNMPNFGSAHKYAKLRKPSQICQIMEALTNMLTEALTIMRNVGSAYKYVKLRKRSQICQNTERSQICQTPEALTNMPNYGSTHKYVKLRKRLQMCQNTEALTNVPKHSGAHKSRYAVPADSVCEAAEQDGPDQKAKH